MSWACVKGCENRMSQLLFLNLELLYWLLGFKISCISPVSMLALPIYYIILIINRCFRYWKWVLGPFQNCPPAFCLLHNCMQFSPKRMRYGVSSPDETLCFDASWWCHSFAKVSFSRCMKISVFLWFLWCLVSVVITICPLCNQN
jgi:hypothetical protein